MRRRLCAEFAILRHQSLVRPSGARLSRNLWTTDDRHQLFEQLRPVPFSREADSATHHQILLGEPLPVYGDGLQVRDWLHVEDHCAAIALALRAAGRRGL